MAQEDLGQATLVYEGPDGEQMEETIDNEHVAYFQDHWIVKTDDGEAEHDTVRRIPASRVYYVERDVEQFEEEIKTLTDEVQSMAGGVEQELRTLRSRLESVAGDVPSRLLGSRRRGERQESEQDVQRIEVGGAGSTDESAEMDEGEGEEFE